MESVWCAPTVKCKYFYRRNVCARIVSNAIRATYHGRCCIVENTRRVRTAKRDKKRKRHDALFMYVSNLGLNRSLCYFLDCISCNRQHIVRSNSCETQSKARISSCTTRTSRTSRKGECTRDKGRKEGGESCARKERRHTAENQNVKGR